MLHTQQTCDVKLEEILLLGSHGCESEIGTAQTSFEGALQTYQDCDSRKCVHSKEREKSLTVIKSFQWTQHLLTRCPHKCQECGDGS